MDMLRCSPAEHELSTRENDGADHHGRETALGDGAVASGVVRLVVEELVVDVCAAADHGAEEDA